MFAPFDDTCSKPVLADIAVLDRIGSDEGNETARLEQLEDAADEIDDEITQAGRT